MELLFVSDLHIVNAKDPMYGALLHIINQRASAGDVLFLAGDVFDLFVGHKKFFINEYQEFFLALKKAIDRGVLVHYIEGNHDFLVEKSIGGVPGVCLHSHHIEYETHGKRFYIAHGDTIDRLDYGYLFLRAFFRSPVMQFLIYLMPGVGLERIGKYLSMKSGASRPRVAVELSLRNLERLRKVYRNYAAEKMTQGFDFVVLGHCHDLDEMYFHIGDRLGQYVNVGYPRAHGSFLSWTTGEEKIYREKLPVAQ